jgi:hypothetical protein
MRFTYRREEEVIIMTTRTDTKKYELLCSSPKVAILVHDFPSLRKEEEEEEGGEGGGEGGAATAEGEGAGEGHTYAITLNGVASMQKGEEAERFRALHLENNVAYSQFIEGEKIAVFTVHVTSARICNVEDRVTYWDKHTAKAEEEAKERRNKVERV